MHILVKYLKPLRVVFLSLSCDLVLWGFVNPPPTRRALGNGRPWSCLDLLSAAACPRPAIAAACPGVLAAAFRNSLSDTARARDVARGLALISCLLLIRDLLLLLCLIVGTNLPS
jgi:hypothetical protein